MYQRVIDDVIDRMRDAFIDEGSDERTLQELREVGCGGVAGEVAGGRTFAQAAPCSCCVSRDVILTNPCLSIAPKVWMARLEEQAVHREQTNYGNGGLRRAPAVVVPQRCPLAEMVISHARLLPCPAAFSNPEMHSVVLGASASGTVGVPSASSHPPLCGSIPPP